MAAVLLRYNLITLPCYDVGMGWMQENCNIINVTQIAASRCQAATITGDSVTFAKSVMEILLPQNPILVIANYILGLNYGIAKNELCIMG